MGTAEKKSAAQLAHATGSGNSREEDCSTAALLKQTIGTAEKKGAAQLAHATEHEKSREAERSTASSCSRQWEEQRRRVTARGKGDQRGPIEGRGGQAASVVELHGGRGREMIPCRKGKRENQRK